MDSLSQIALGAAVGVAVMGRRTAVWKSALWGGVCGTLPDLDSLIDHGDPLLNMVRHRAESHALFWLSLAAPLIAFAIAALHRELDRYRRWWLAVWLVLVTHPLLDAMTVYGTRLLLPFDDTPLGLGSIFIIDPLYTLPLVIGLGVTLASRGRHRLRANLVGLAVSTAYLCWSAIAQTIVEEQVRHTLAAQGVAEARVLPILVTPTPFNTVLWRIVVLRGERYEEGFVSLLDRGQPPRFESFDRGLALHARVRELPTVERMASFTHGFFRTSERDARIAITDLRMGQEPFYSFSFVVAVREAASDAIQAVRPVGVGGRRGMDVRAALHWLWRRALGEDVELRHRPTPVRG